MKVKFFYTNGFCECDETEIVDFPNVTDINDSEIVCYGNGSFEDYMYEWADDRFIDYPFEGDFESHDDYEEACNEAFEMYFENGNWWCEEYNEEDE